MKSQWLTQKNQISNHIIRISIYQTIYPSATKKMLHDSMVRDHEYAEALRREAAVKYCKLWFPFNPNVGVTEK